MSLKDNRDKGERRGRKVNVELAYQLPICLWTRHGDFITDFLCRLQWDDNLHHILPKVSFREEQNYYFTYLTDISFHG